MLSVKFERDKSIKRPELAYSFEDWKMLSQFLLNLTISEMSALNVPLQKFLNKKGFKNEKAIFLIKI